ncbi:AAA family ATPase [Microbacterium lacticum]
MASDDDDAFLSQFQQLLRRLNERPDDRPGTLTPLGERLQEHLGADPRHLPVVVEQVPPHRLIDLDLALEDVSAGTPSKTLGVTGGQARHHEDLASLIQNPYTRFAADAAVEYATVADGPRSTRQVVAMGLRLLRWRGKPLVALQRAANPRYGRSTAELEILASDVDTTTAFIDELRRRMNALSVVRGQVVTFGRDEYGQGIGPMTFLDRPDVSADAVILPTGVLERVRDHVVGVTENADALRARGQHLKRGVLLYGPPGTGKTLTVRYLLHELPEATTVLLQGGSLGLVAEAARLARALAPAIVVLEDVDLVAAERGTFGLQPMLFEVLDALDGIDGDADVAFVLTTNRADVLEPALAARPGRIDLAVEIPLPDAAARRELFALYAAGLPLRTAALEAAADEAEGETASFAKELIRRAVLRATLAGREVTDDDLAAALTELRESTEGVSRILFGGEPGGTAHPGGAGGGAAFIAGGFG